MAERNIPIVASSHLKSVTYDDDSKQLVVSFTNGSYAYEQVPADVADGFATAPSAGGYLHAQIKSRYEAKKL